MSLFKYIKSKYLTSILENGEFRIGTIHDYRNTQKYGKEVGELTEGLITLEFDAWEGREIDLSSDIYEAALLRHCLNIKPDDPYLKNKIRFNKGSEMQANLQTANGYIFCSTTQFSISSMKSFNCDVCIEIFDPRNFILAISESIRNKAKYVKDGKVFYTEKQQNYRGLKDLHPSMLKPVEYKHQSEHRIIWEPISNDPVEPFVVQSPKATEFCRIYQP